MSCPSNTKRVTGQTTWLPFILEVRSADGSPEVFRKSFLIEAFGIIKSHKSHAVSTPSLLNGC